ncbi:MAG: hypothetical protein IPP19_15395 [Verrucomicrobia bacterium]|nr:hypothetical protein [Verrucomicrobiota bacterium]
MKNSKLERALYGPTIYEITLGLLLSVVLGAALGIVFLVFKPATVVQEMPKEDERIQGMTYYVEGTIDHGKAKQWMRKRQMLIDSVQGEVAFTEDDLNTWFMSSTPAGQEALAKAAQAAAEAAAAAKPGAKSKAKPAAKPAAPAPAADAAPAEELPPTDLIVASVINFRIRDGVVQLGLPTTINTLGYVFPVVAQARGGFEKVDDMYVFVPDEVMIGSLPLHRFPRAIEYMMKRAMQSDALPSEMMAAWKKVKTVVVEDKVIKLTI